MSDASKLNLGKIITDEQERDAIHIAVAPVVAWSDLVPGEHVGFVVDGQVASCKNPIGIVDPFLSVKKVKKGQRIWLFLYPGSITSLRHDWTHPAFIIPEPEVEPEIKPEPKMRLSAVNAMKWVEQFAGHELGMTYTGLMGAAENWVAVKDYTLDNSMRYEDVSDSQWRKFWDRYEEITGAPVLEQDKCSFFSCSC